MVDGLVQLVVDGDAGRCHLACSGEASCVVGVVGRPGQGEELAFLRGSALGCGQGRSAGLVRAGCAGPGPRLLSLAVGVPFEPGFRRCRPLL